MASSTPRGTTNTSPWRWAGVGAALGLLLSSVLWAPARWLATAIEQATNHRVQLRQTTGTVWSGDALLALSPGPGPDSNPVRSLPSRIRWQWGWANGGLRLSLASDCCTPQTLQWWLRREDGHWVLGLDDQISTWPLSPLASLGAPWNTLQPEGRLQWQTQGLRLSEVAGRWLWHGQAQLQVQGLASSLSTLRPMGSYRLVLEGGPTGTATPQLTLSTLSGPLRLSGQGQWLGQHLRFAGEASADEGFETALSNLLNIIGRREGSRSRLSLG